MSITFGDHLIDSGYHDITPEQEREIEAREECARRGIDPDELCADGGVEAWTVVAQEIAMRPRPVTAVGISASCHREKWRFEGTPAFDVLHRIGDMALCEHERLSEELDPEIGFPSDDLLRRIHLDVETRGRKNPDFAVTVHHRNIVLSAVAHALRKQGCSWEDWLEACGWPRGAGSCECYRPGDCDGSCTHPKPTEKP